MGIWKRTVAAIKDKKSLAGAYFSSRSSDRNLDFEAAIIKATSHDEYDTGERNERIVFRWIQASPENIYPLVRALSKRMRKTRSWVVAIKGLILMHDLSQCKDPAVAKMGRLPFDLSSFSDGHSRLSKTWGFNVFIRQYFAFLDERGAIWFKEENRNAEDGPLMVQKLLKIRKWQLLLDMLLKIRPRADNMKICLILEAMDRVVIEIFDVYSRICSEIAEVLSKVHSLGSLQASMALEILRTATKQGEELSQYFEFCKEYGVLKANEFITVTEIPEEDVEELERIINGASNNDDGFKEKNQMALVVREEHRAIVEHRETKETLKTTITDKWEVFDDDVNIHGDNVTGYFKENNTTEVRLDSDQPLIPVEHVAVINPCEIPDLISF
ncbi:hypothetical protein V6N13_115748 [Hibiscus sabdariffa]|uniref:ENTH domain-containing protein n=1 Tax=Hibiscus sabdariffa TaxID=183260 RepID=A0ABR2CSN7_9ROSI